MTVEEFKKMEPWKQEMFFMLTKMTDALTSIARSLEQLAESEE